MTKSSKIVFFGNERLSTGFVPNGAPTLQKLLKSGYDVVAVVSSYERGHSRTARKLEIADIAKINHIPVFLPQKPADIHKELVNLNAAMGVLVAYGRLVPQSIIDIFPHGILNIHPSLLPTYRGPTPIEQAILDGVSTTGVSIMQLAAAMDAGPIVAQKELALNGNETKQELTDSLLAMGGDLLIASIPKLLHGDLVPTPQDESKASFCSRLSKEDSLLDPKKSASQLERQVRAFATWPKSHTLINGHKIVVLNARVVAQPQPQMLCIACSDSTFLEITELIAPSGRRMSGADFMRGYSVST